MAARGRGVRLWLLLAFVAFSLGSAHAGESGAAPSPPADGKTAAPAKPAVAPKSAIVRERTASGTVTIFNRPVVTFRSTVLGVGPDDRAESAEKRILALLERGGEGRVTVEKIDLGDVIKIDGGLAFILSDSDVQPLSGDTLATIADRAVAALTTAIAETREARNARLMLEAAIWAGIATIVYVLCLLVLRFARRGVTRRLLHVADVAAVNFRIGGTAVVNRRRAFAIARHLVQWVFWAVVLLLTYQWVGFLLGRFPFTRAWGEQLNSFLATTTIDFLTAVAASIPELLVVVVIFFLARTVVGMLHNFFDGVQANRIDVGWLDADSARPTRRITTFVVWVFALAMAYPYIPGSGTEAFKGLSVLLGLMVSIGASGIVGQAASGLILMYTRTFRPGEYVRIGESEGTIVDMGMFTTRLRTGLGEEVTVPNTLALSAVSRNYSRAVKGAGFILDATVTIGYDALWRQVQAMLIEAAKRTPGVLADPAPHVFQTALSDFYVEYRLVCQAVPKEAHARAEALSLLNANVLDVFNEHGVQIMSPHYLGDPTTAKVVPKSRWYEAPARQPR